MPTRTGKVYGRFVLDIVYFEGNVGSNLAGSGEDVQATKEVFAVAVTNGQPFLTDADVLMTALPVYQIGG